MHGAVGRHVYIHDRNRRLCFFVCGWVSGCGCVYVGVGVGVGAGVGVGVGVDLGVGVGVGGWVFGWMGGSTITNTDCRLSYDVPHRSIGFRVSSGELCVHQPPWPQPGRSYTPSSTMEDSNRGSL